MRIFFLYLNLLLASFLPLSTAGAEKSMEGLDDLEGRTSILATRCIVQDERGMIWFGTTKGLYSYDGYEVSHYLPVGQIYVNSLTILDNLIYIGFNDGLGIYDISRNEFSKVGFLSGEAVRAFSVVDDMIYIGTASGLYRYPWNEKDSPSRIERLSSKEVFSISRMNDRIWIGAIDGLGYFDLGRNMFLNMDLDVFIGRNIRIVTYIFPQNDATIWFGTPDSMVKIDTENDKAEEVVQVPVLKTILPFDDDTYYIGTDDGLYCFDLSERRLNMIDHCVVWSSMTDDQGNLWFATDNGLKMIRKDRGLHTIDTDNLPANAIYYGMLRDGQDRVWAWGTYGILLFESEGKDAYRLVRHYSMGEGLNQIPHNRVKTMVEDKHDGRLYVATDGGNLIYNEVTGCFDRHGIVDSYNWIYDILIDGNRIWYASFDGLFCVRDNEVQAKYTKSDGLSTDDIAQVVKDRKGKIWIRTRDRNVFTLEPKSGNIVRFPVEDFSESGFCESILSDLEGNIWLSAQSDLIHVNNVLNESKVTSYTLESNRVLEVYSMNDFLGNVWVCSSEGIYTLDKASFDVTKVDIGEICVSVHYDYKTDNILLGGVGKISCISMDDFENFMDKDTSPVHITSVVVNGDFNVSSQELHEGYIVLGYEENNISISLSDFTYGKDLSNRFFMTMKHNNATWNESISGNTIFLPNLSPGRYSLSFSSGSMNPEQESRVLEIRIKHPWYFSVPMIIIYALAVIGVIILILHAFTMKHVLALEKQQRNVLLEQSRQKEAFFGNVAHEFKTPLSLIIAPLGKLINDNRNEEELAVLKMAHENAVKLNSLIHNTIDYYRDTQTTGINFIRSEVEFVEFAKAIFDSYKVHFPKHEFIFESMTDRIIAEVDIVKMEMVLTNLMSNACKFTPEGGSVIMTLEREDNNSRFFLKLSDTGIGIPKEEFHLVFQRYFESSRSKGGHYDSTGIGLSLIKEYVESHDGVVSVDSDDLGTTFTLVLPCRRQNNAPAGKESDESKAADAGKPLVVIVDDNPQICSFLETVLKNKYRCISSNNGKSGLKLCKDVIPDLIISDVMMPVMDGMEMCRQLRECPPLTTIPIILLTAKGDKNTEEQSIQLNVDTFVTKPFEFSTLVTKIDQLIGNRHRMEQKLRVEMISTPVDNHELSLDEKYLKKVTRIIEEHIDDDSLSVKTLCELGGFNEKQLYRRTKQLTGMSTVEYIRSIRLKKAAILLQKGNFTVSEVMYSVGFNNASYFTRAFSSEYGKTPSEYMKAYRK